MLAVLVAWRKAGQEVWDGTANWAVGYVARDQAGGQLRAAGAHRGPDHTREALRLPTDKLMLVATWTGGWS